ncbi:MAG: hypothetical protein LBP85_00445 [Prevotellaceae bacterium]|jgi:hypothetical protein|nr:hypothetical protein [Prevotellaceae bacterium]
MNFKTITIVWGRDNYRFVKRQLPFEEKAADCFGKACGGLRKLQKKVNMQFKNR